MRLELFLDQPNVGEVEGKVVECIRASLDARLQHYTEACRKLSEERQTPSWSFCAFYVEKVGGGRVDGGG